jgi:hypothetical protein
MQRSVHSLFGFAIAQSAALFQSAESGCMATEMQFNIEKTFEQALLDSLVLRIQMTQGIDKHCPCLSCFTRLTHLEDFTRFQYLHLGEEKVVPSASKHLNA